MRDGNGDSGKPDELLARQVRALESISTLLRLVAVAAAIVVLVAVLGEVVMIIFAAVLIAVMLRGAAARIGRLAGIGTGWSLLLVVVATTAFFAGMGWWRGPKLVHEADQLRDALGTQFTALQAQMRQTDWGRSLLQQLPFGLGTGGITPANLGGRIETLFPHIAGIVTSALWSVLGLIGTLGVILVAALYMAAAPQPYVHGLTHVLPRTWRPAARHILDRIGHDLWGWLVGQFFDMLIVGALCGVGLVLLGMPLAFVLAVIAGLTNFVPYIGAIGGAVPAVLIAFSIGPKEALFVALLYLAVQLFEGNVTAPLIQRRAIDLPPSLTILSQTALGVIFGLFGVILATPFTAAVIAAVQGLEDESPDY
ncbi:MAG: AI-2E family transporter [Acetobacteraceae bacterium]|nr:AI-2E family transporter [Acetobacteraceae bacterium]